MDPLVSTAWLAANLKAPDLRIVDGSFYLPAENKSARQEYLERHIPGAVFFDIDDIADSSSSLPHMLPSPEKFSSKVRKLGLGDGLRIVVYDSRGGLFSAPRVRWTFKVFGHPEVAVLDGGLNKWLAENRPVEDGPPSPGERHFTARANSFLVRELQQMQANLKSKREQVLDARARARFEGASPELWPGRRAGHIPGSRNPPYTELANADGTLKSPEELRQLYAKAGIDLSAPVITSCGSGITAAVLALGLEVAGAKNVAVYDGSWAEWGLPELAGRDERPVATGPAER
nr:thiosulfate sulfurtransferase, rhodanese [uncultured bacterium]